MDITMKGVLILPLLLLLASCGVVRVGERVRMCIGFCMDAELIHGVQSTQPEVLVVPKESSLVEDMAKSTEIKESHNHTKFPVQNQCEEGP